MSKTTMHNSEASLEFRDLRDGLSDEELKKVSGGYIGETEKNASETITGRRIQKFQ
jgi:bacteriocin-like protein